MSSRACGPQKLYYGEADLDVFPRNTEVAAAKMRAAGVQVTLVDPSTEHVMFISRSSGGIRFLRRRVPIFGKHSMPLVPNTTAKMPICWWTFCDCIEHACTVCLAIASHPPAAEPEGLYPLIPSSLRTSPRRKLRWLRRSPLEIS